MGKKGHLRCQESTKVHIEKTLANVQGLLNDFNSGLKQFEDAEIQKERFMSEMGKQITKLQKYQPQINNWIHSQVDANQKLALQHVVQHIQEAIKKYNKIGFARTPVESSAHASSHASGPSQGTTAPAESSAHASSHASGPSQGTTAPAESGAHASSHASGPSQGTTAPAESSAHASSHASGPSQGTTAPAESGAHASPHASGPSQRTTAPPKSKPSFALIVQSKNVSPHHMYLSDLLAQEFVWEQTERKLMTPMFQSIVRDIIINISNRSKQGFEMGSLEPTEILVIDKYKVFLPDADNMHKTSYCDGFLSLMTKIMEEVPTDDATHFKSMLKKENLNVL